MMKWSWRFARLFGFDIKVHASFVLALIYGAAVWGGGTWRGAAYGVTLTLVLFSVVVAHELGHAVAARRYGIAVEDIVLLPIGGVARLQRMPSDPRQELVVALAGPAVNLAQVVLLVPFVLGALLWQRFQTGAAQWPDAMTPGWLNIGAFLLMVNLSLLLFNMLPAFPMDGGRVLRALLAMRYPSLKATMIAAGVGRFFAFLFAVFAIWSGNFFVGSVAYFVFAGARSEAEEARRDARPTQPSLIEAARAAPALLADTPAHLAFERLSTAPSHVLAVVDRCGELVGLVTASGMERGWAAGLRGPVERFVEHSAVV
jgi:Zn-dependent protease